MENKKIEILIEYLVNNSIKTEEEISLYDMKTLNDILYHRTGCRDLEKLQEDDLIELLYNDDFTIEDL